MARVALRFAYDGSRFDSFARQPRRRTVEGELIATLVAFGGIKNPRKARYEVASRTDAGVSALDNVCAFDTATHPQALVHQARPPEGLVLLAALGVDAAFSPRRAARRRRYGYALPSASPAELRRMRAAAKAFMGVHEFGNFARPDPGAGPSRRRLDSIGIVRAADGAIVRVEAASFLWEQVRRMVTAIVKVGDGTWAVSEIQRRLRADVRAPVAPAPAAPLVLERVDVGLRFSTSRATQKRLAELEASAGRVADFYSALAASSPRDRR